MKRLAIITTHPIQYHAPVFKLLSERKEISSKIFYTWSQSEKGTKYDPGFGRNIEWDIPLLQGYEFNFVKNTAPDPGTHHFKGIINPTLIEEIKEWGPDAILVFGWSFHSHLNCLRYFHKKIPVLFRGDSTLLNERPGAKKIMRRIFLIWVYHHVDTALYVGKLNRSYYLKHGLKEHQLIFAPHAVDNDRFSDHEGEYERNANAWREKLNISRNDLVFLYAGKLEPVKNIDFLINGFLKFWAKQFNGNVLHLVIVGNGVLENELKQKYGDFVNLHFIDFQNQTKMPVVYRIGDVFVLPSISETWGLSVNEAMASDRAVLVSDKTGCASDLVETGKNGYVYGANNKPDLEEKLDNFMANKAAIKGMGKVSGDKITNWNFTAIVTAIENVVIKKLND